MKKSVKICIVACLLAAVMLVYNVPVQLIQALADEIGDAMTVESSIEQKYYPGGMVDEYNIGNGDILQENTENRTLTTKEFLMSDNTIMVQQFIEPVHYYEDGVYKEIDNTLTEKVQNGKKIYENNANSLKVKFQEGLSDHEFLEIEEGGYALELGFMVKSPEKEKAELNDSDDEKSVSVSKIRPQIGKTPIGQIKYDIADKETEIVYEIKNNKLNENIVIAQKQEQYSYTFEIQSENLQFAQKEDGSIVAYNEFEETKFIIPVPYMTDANDTYSNAVTCTLTETDGKSELTITADAAWINENAVLPVTITSEIESVQDKQFSYANVHENGNTVINADRVYAGKKDGAEKSDVYFNFELPEVASYYQLIGAAFNFEYETNGMGLFNGKDLNYDIFVAESTADLSGITYNEKPEKIQSLKPIRRNSQRAEKQSTYESDIINVNNIKDNRLTIGIEPTEDMSEDGYISIATSASATTGVTYWYERVIGIEDDYSMESFEISGVSAHVNNGTGKLNAVLDLISVNTLSDIPFTASLVYNDYYDIVLSDIGKTSIAGNNFKLNFQQFMISRGNVYELIDADGSISTFYSVDSGLYYSKEKKLYYNPSTYTVYDVLGNQMKFSGGRLTEISSQNNPSEYIKVVYASNSSDNISQVVYYANSVAKYTMDFTYSNGKIAYVTTNADANKPCKIALEYDEDGNLIGIKNQTGSTEGVQVITLGYCDQMLYDDPADILNYVFDNLKSGIIFYRDIEDMITEARYLDGEDISGLSRYRSRVTFGYYGIYTKIYCYEDTVMTNMKYVSFNNTKKVISEWQQDSKGIVTV